MVHFGIGHYRFNSIGLFCSLLKRTGHAKSHPKYIICYHLIRKLFSDEDCYFIHKIPTGISEQDQFEGVGCIWPVPLYSNIMTKVD